MQYGMTEEQFWFGKPELIQVYQKAYLRDKSYTAWLQGQFFAIAYDTVMGNAFGKGGKKKEYPQWKDPYEKIVKPKLTKENLEYEFRKQQIEQNAWLFGR